MPALKIPPIAWQDENKTAAHNKTGKKLFFILYNFVLQYK
jgi:hypothetical protein